MFSDTMTLPADLTLDAASPCIDVANGDVALATDIVNTPRTDIGPPGGGFGTPAYVDRGAYEYVP